ncbi:unnamed protein product [Adineta steineri]|uniref:Uncharacterized protein n=1 Tax=Adineta steineri TaxID=433720 RepID=A0A814BLP6_9BILA|nr:unnamed protein product [Adineta steineri]CAF0931077.1 unnamed protein product [Adineta steineri]
MSKIVHSVSCKTRDDKDKSHIPKQTRRNTHTHMDSETIISTLTGFENDLGEKLEQIDREAELQVQQIELSECLMLTSQLVDLFKHTVITFELQNQNDWHNDTRHQLKKRKTVTVNTLLDDKIEKIVINKGLTKEQWKCLLYISFINGDTIEITKVNKKHLHKIRDKASRLLEPDERDAVLALINAIEKHMPKEHFISK